MFAGEMQIVQNTKIPGALPRGLRHVSQINKLQKSGTPNRSTESLGFLRQVSHQKHVTDVRFTFENGHR
jgi:hypothetical protein